MLIDSLLLELSQAKVDGSYARLLGQLARIELLILDDWGELGGQHPGRCDPGSADAQRSPAVTEGRIDEKEEV